MSQIKLLHSGGNGVILSAPDSNPASDRTLKLPGDADGTIATTATAGKILQVVSTTKNDTASVTNATYADISGLTATITPSSASNKILISFVLQYGGHNNSYVAWKAYRGSTLLPVGTGTTSNATNASFGGFQEQSNSQYGVQTAVWQYLDSPNSTSALTYKIQWASLYQSYTSYINRPYSTSNETFNSYASSSITVYDVSA